MPMDIQVGDVLTMKKAHPCGEKRWQAVLEGAVGQHFMALRTAPEQQKRHDERDRKQHDDDGDHLAVNIRQQKQRGEDRNEKQRQSHLSEFIRIAHGDTPP